MQIPMREGGERLKISLLCLGAEGAMVAEGLLTCALSGIVSREDVVRVTLLYPPEAALRRLNSLYADYAGLRGAWGLDSHTGLQPILSLRSLTGSPSLAGMVTEPRDEWLLQAFCTAEAAHSPAMSGTAQSASTAWRMLLRQPEGVLADLLQDAGEMPTVVAGALAEPCCGGAVPHLVKALLAAAGSQPVGAVFLTPFRQEDAEEDANAALAVMPELSCLGLLGLPADCRVHAGTPHLLHLLAIRSVIAFMNGCTGTYTVAAAQEKAGWDCFSPNGDVWGRQLNSLLLTAALWECFYAPEANRSLSAPNLLRDRLNPWFNAFFTRRKPDPEQRQRAMRQLEAARRLFHAAVCFLRDVQASLPYVFCPIPELKAAEKAAAAHYDTLLTLAGQYALVSYDNEQTSLHDTSFVHRGSAEDTAVDQALQEQDLLEEDLKGAQEAQNTLNRVLGARIVRSMLAGFDQRTRDAYQDLQQQAREAHRRIEVAAQIARPEEMAKIDQARARLRRMERRVANLEGRAHQAQVDHALSLQEPLTPPPALEELTAAPPSVFWPHAWLSLLCDIGEEHTRSRQRLIQELLSVWPAGMPPVKALQEQILHEKPGSHPDAALAFLDAVFSVASRRDPVSAVLPV